MIIWWATIINFWESSQGYTYLMGYYYLIGKSKFNIFGTFELFRKSDPYVTALNKIIKQLD